MWTAVASVSDAQPGLRIGSAVQHQDALAQAIEAIGADHDAAARQSHAHNLAALLQGMHTFGNQRCDPVRTVPGNLGDRWSSLIMHLLHGGMLRHTELRRLIGVVSAEHEISQRMLTLKLRVLERDGLVQRSVTADVPPRTEYRLSGLGFEAYVQFAALVRWAEHATAAIRLSRTRYDAQHPDAAQLLRESGGAESD